MCIVSANRLIVNREEWLDRVYFRKLRIVRVKVGG